MSRSWCIHTIEHNSALRRNKPWIHTSTWVNVTDVIWSKKKTNIKVVKHRL